MFRLAGTGAVLWRRNLQKEIKQGKIIPKSSPKQIKRKLVFINEFDEEESFIKCEEALKVENYFRWYFLQNQLQFRFSDHFLGIFREMRCFTHAGVCHIKSKPTKYKDISYVYSNYEWAVELNNSQLMSRKVKARSNVHSSIIMDDEINIKWAKKIMNLKLIVRVRKLSLVVITKT